MAKSRAWLVPAGEAEVRVTYTLQRLTGRMIVSINREEFRLSAGFLSLRAARREPFRILNGDGEAEQAILVVDKQGQGRLWFRGKELPPEA